MTRNTLMKTEVHAFYSLFAAQAFIATLKAEQKSYRTARAARPKPGKPIYRVFVYNAA
jgi:hypothetical protein